MWRIYSNPDPHGTVSKEEFIVYASFKKNKLDSSNLLTYFNFDGITNIMFNPAYIPYLVMLSKRY
jgi:hypothetical protein